MYIKRLINVMAAVAVLGALSTANAANIVNLISTIDGAQANAGAGTGSPGTGTATMTLDLDTSTFSWNIAWQDLSGPPTVAHFHGPAAAGVNAGVQVSIATTSPAIDSAILDAGQIADLLAGLWYINIHTSLNTGGEIRGQVLLDTDNDGDPDVTDPDDDNDGIGDALDNQPLVADNNCTTNNGTNATLVGATISAEQATCASKESVDVSGTTNVGVDGDLRLISEKVSLTDTSVTDNGRMEVINADPCPGCVFPPAFFQLGVPVADYQALFNQLVANGFRPVWIDGYRSGGQSFINAIFDKTQVASWASAHGQNGADYQTFFNDQTSAGRTLVHVDSYRQGNDIVYASIFVDQPGPPWIAYSGLTNAQHQVQFNNLVGLGYRASIISVVEDFNGVARYSGLYDQSNVGGWVALTGLTSAQYNAEFANQANAGRALAYLNGYTINGSPRFTAIWNSNVPNSWVGVHDRTSAQFQSDFDLRTGQGLLTRIVTGYDNGGTANFAGLWTD